MKWSIKLGKLLGIDVYLHVTFLLLLAFLGFTYWRATQNAAATLQGIAFIVALFGCVVLHELGHALMARRYGIKTRDIIRRHCAWKNCRSNESEDRAWITTTTETTSKKREKDSYA